MQRCLPACTEDAHGGWCHPVKAVTVWWFWIYFTFNHSSWVVRKGRGGGQKSGAGWCLWFGWLRGLTGLSLPSSIAMRQHFPAGYLCRLWHVSSSDITCCKPLLLAIIIHCFKEKKKREKRLVSEFCCSLWTKSQVLHLPIPLFISLLFPLGSNHPVCSFLIIHSSTKRFCPLFIAWCDIFFMLEMFGMPLKVAKSFCGGPACRKKVFKLGVFWAK